MTWNLGFQGLSLLFVMAFGFALVGAGAGGADLAHRLRTGIITGIACLLVGVFTSEVWFGWATEEELQPNIDGLSFDEVLISGIVTTALVVMIARRFDHRRDHNRKPGPRHLLRRTH